MTDAPERIWLLPHDGEQRCWCDHPDPSGMGHEDEADEYIRADLVEAMEAENQRLREALRPFANAGTLFDGLPGEVEFDQCIYSPAAGKEYSLCGDDLRRARAALAKIGEAG